MAARAAGFGAPLQMLRSKAMAAEDRAAAPIRARTDFSALALFAASLPTDAEGRARVAVKLPDSLTRYRVMAVAVEGARRFGSGEATLVARLPLMVRPSRAALPELRRSLRAAGRRPEPDGRRDDGGRRRSAPRTPRSPPGAGRRLVVAANDRAEVRFPMAAVRAGRARIQVGAASGRAADAAEVELPVWTPATTEAFATYGQVDDGSVVQPVKAPAGVVPDFGGLEVTTSSTALQALTDAVLYLVAYPFECAEQLSSRVLAVAALRDVLAAFQAEGLPKPEETLAAVKRDVERLRALQNGDGGFAFWRRGDESWPYVSIHVAHALARAKAKGFAVPDDTLERSRRLPARDRPAHPLPIREGRAPHAPGLRALRARAPGRRRPGARPGARARGRRRDALLRGARLGAAAPLEGRGLGGRAGRHPPPPRQQRRRRRPRRRTSPSPTATTPTCSSTPTGAPTPSCSRRSSRTSPGATSSRSSWRASSPTAGPAAGRTRRRTSSSCWRSTATSRPTRRRRPTSWPAPGSASATRARTSSGAAPPSATASRSRWPTCAKRKAAIGSPPRQGGPRTALLPDRPALRARQPRPRAARPRLHGRALVRGRRRPEGRDSAPTTAPGGSGPAPASACGSRWSRRRGGTTWRSSTRCPPASSR